MNVLFIPTASSAVMYWRVQNFVEAAYRNRTACFQNPLWFKDLNGPQEWQLKLSDGPNFDSIYARRFVPMIESGCREADVIVCQYGHENGAIDLLESIKIKFPNTPVLVEIDDLITSVPVYNEAFGAYDHGSDARARVIEQLKSADGLIVSTPHLKEAYSQYNQNIWVVPNSIDFNLWGRAKRKKLPGIRIGWAGGNGHEGDFAIIENAIKNIIKKHKEVTFVFVNGPAKKGLPDFLKGVERIEHKAIFEPVLKYPSMIAGLDFDIGICPLIDSNFNRGKSNLKWLEGAALSYPVVASNVGHFKETLTHGVDVLLANNEKEFEAHLDSLILDKKLRKRIGAAAHRKAYEDFNVDKVTEHYIACLKEAKSLKSVPQFSPITHSLGAQL